MDLELRYRHNYKNVLLNNYAMGEKVGVRRRDGSIGYASWRGFIDRETAKRLPGAKPVKLVVEEYRVMAMEWQKVPEGQYIQGCLLGQYAYAVLEWAVRVV